MSTNTREFRKLIVLIGRAQESGASDKSRLRKNKRINGLLLHQDLILEEIKDSRSPFVAIDNLTESELRTIANKIARDLWGYYTRAGVAGVQFFKGEEQDFLSFDGRAIFIDKTKRTVYVRGGHGVSHFDVMKTLTTKIRQKIDKTNNIDLRKFFSKNPDFFAKKDVIEARIRKDLADRGLKHDGQAVRNKARTDTEHKELTAANKGLNNRGTELGHVFGGQATVAASLFQDPELLFSTNINDLEISNIIPAKFRASLKTAIIKTVGADANLELKKKLTPGGAFSGVDAELRVVFLTPELSKKNNKEGNDIKTAFQNFVIPELRKIANSFPELKGSPSYNELMREYIEALFLGKKIKGKTFVTKVKLKGKKRDVILPIGILHSTKISTRPTTKSGGKLDRINMRSLIALINAKLHDAIQEDMGKGNSKKKLNYRTGRFARSAKLESLIPMSETQMGAIVKYMKKPYNVFEPGGRLHKGLKGREPAGIFGRSIRRILQEEQLAKLRRVKVELR